MSESEISTEEMGILRHSLGLAGDGTGTSYRNHFVTGPGTDDHPHCIALVSKGLMQRHAPSAISGGMDIFTVTPDGAARAKTDPPKLTRAQRRYRRWLAADSSLPFGEWIRPRA